MGFFNKYRIGKYEFEMLENGGFISYSFLVLLFDILGFGRIEFILVKMS